MVKPCCDEGHNAAIVRDRPDIDIVRAIACVGNGQRCLVLGAQFDVIDHDPFFRGVVDFNLDVPPYDFVLFHISCLLHVGKPPLTRRLLA